jgi:hypothetical protein
LGSPKVEPYTLRIDSTATGWPAASSRARRTAARLNGAPGDASSTAASVVGCGSKRRRPNSISPAT